MSDLIRINKLCSYHDGWYTCTGLSRKLRAAGLTTIQSATFLPDSFKPIMPGSHLSHGQVTDLSSVLLHTDIRYHDIEVRPWTWPPDSHGDVISCSTSPKYNAPSSLALRALQNQYGKAEYEELLLKDGWIQINTLEFRKNINISELDRITSITLPEYLVRINKCD